MLHPKQQHIVNIYGKSPTTLTEVAEAVLAVIQSQEEVVAFHWSIDFSDSVGGYFHAPVGYEKDLYKENVPRHLGFKGRVDIRYKHVKLHTTFAASGNFEATLTRPGSGSRACYYQKWIPVDRAYYKLYGRNDDEPAFWGWDYTFFLEDWPDLIIKDEIRAHEQAEHERQVWTILQCKYFQKQKYTLHHDFEWIDPEVQAQDLELLAKFEELDLQE